MLQLRRGPGVLSGFLVLLLLCVSGQVRAQFVDELLQQPTGLVALIIYSVSSILLAVISYCVTRSCANRRKRLQKKADERALAAAIQAQEKAELQRTYKSKDQGDGPRSAKRANRSRGERSAGERSGGARSHHRRKGSNASSSAGTRNRSGSSGGGPSRSRGDRRMGSRSQEKEQAEGTRRRPGDGGSSGGKRHRKKSKRHHRDGSARAEATVVDTAPGISFPPSDDESNARAGSGRSRSGSNRSTGSRSGGRDGASGSNRKADVPDRFTLGSGVMPDIQSELLAENEAAGFYQTSASTLAALKEEGKAPGEVAPGDASDDDSDKSVDLGLGKDYQEELPW